MLKSNYKLIGVALLASVFFYSCSQDQNSPEEEAVFSENDARFDAQNIEGQYIVVFNKNMIEDVNSKYPENYSKAQEAMTEQTRKVLAKASISSAEIVNVYSKTLSGATMKLTKSQVEQLKGKKEIAYIEQDRIVVFAPPCGTPNGGPCGEPDPGTGGSQETPYGILRVNGIANYTGTAVAWVVDTGIDLDHPDLNVDALRGFNAFTSGRDSKSIDDGNGHGTHVSGTIAAKNNDFGVIGVAPGATVIPVKVLDSRGSGSYSGVIAGVDFVGAKGKSGDVANLSLGGPVSQALDDAILAASNKGIKFALAAGNESSDANNSSPARVNGANIVTISAMDVNDTWAYFSNFGNPPVDFAAPGLAIKSTWKGGGYNTISGTSMAAPHAAGVLLLGAARTDGFVTSDPDGNPDPIIVH
ncbi:MAG: S8 family peptidase [Flavobacteriaceae bacterium]|nr:S8 family peptidase [Flavobacteriaceae bacterium]